MNNQTVEQKILEIIRDTVTADTGNWGEYGVQNRESQEAAAKEIAELLHSTQPLSAPVEAGAVVNEEKAIEAWRAEGTPHPLRSRPS